MGRSIAYNREDGGQLVREAWVRWAHTQPDPKPSWLLPWEELDEGSKEADRCIWDDLTAPLFYEMAGLVEENVRLKDTINKLAALLEVTISGESKDTTRKEK